MCLRPFHLPFDLARAAGFASLVAVSLCTPAARAQDALPKDQNTINTAAAVSTLEADSPIDFARHPVARLKRDIPDEFESPEAGYSIRRIPPRSLGQIHHIQDEMPKGTFTPPPNDWRHLAKTRQRLATGGDLHIMAVGDSIIADTMRSGWVTSLGEVYPQSNLKQTVYIRGGGGCQHYREESRVSRFVAPAKPDLVYIGGISQRDLAGIREVIRELRRHLPEVEILLGTGCFGKIDPRYPEAWVNAPHNGGGAYRRELARIAAEERCAFLDFTPPWGEYIRSTGLHPHYFYRDPVHANDHGEQILAKILVAFFSAPQSGGR